MEEVVEVRRGERLPFADGAILCALIVLTGGTAHPWFPGLAMVVGGSGVLAACVLVRNLAPFRALSSVALAALFVFSALWSGHAKAKLTAPAGSVERARAVVRSDPRPALGGDVVELDVGGHRWKATIAAKHRGGSWQVGDVVVVSGATSGFARRDAYVDSRHLAGRFRLRTLHSRQAGALPYRLATGVRRVLLRSASGFTDTQRTLFAGFVLGDVRTARAELTDDFRGSGLSHLVVVSGQNLAFLLAGFQPLVRRIGQRSRVAPLAIQLVVIIAFVLVARFEPSVLRAALMAVLFVLTKAFGRPQTLLRLLCLTVGVLLVLDPLLIRSVGFALSVGAVGGIAVLAKPIRLRLEQFGFLAAPLSVTLAAQIGTAPVLLLVFDGVPVVSVLANLVALPVAAPIMGWGVMAGLPAGMVSTGVSDIVHIPTRLLLDLVAWIARIAAGAPFGSIGPADVGLVVAFAGVVWVWREGRPRGDGGESFRQLPPWVLVVMLAVPTVRALGGHLSSSPQRASGSLGRAITWSGSERAGLAQRVDLVVVAHGASASSMLREIRRQRIGAIGVVAVVSGGRPQGEVLRALAHRVDVGVVLSAPGIGSPPGVPWRRAVEGLTLRSGGLEIAVAKVSGRRFEVVTRSIGAARGPPEPVRPAAVRR